MEIDWGGDDDSDGEHGEDEGKMVEDDKDDFEVGEGKDSDGKHRLSCDICHEAMGASTLLLLRTDDWCGHLECRCYQCSLTEESFTGTEREFGKKIRHMWKQRKVETGRVVASHEQATWKNPRGCTARATLASLAACTGTLRSTTCGPSPSSWRRT